QTQRCSLKNALLCGGERRKLLKLSNKGLWHTKSLTPQVQIGNGTANPAEGSVLEWEAAIPRFFFDHWDESKLVRDDDGLDLADLDPAYLDAFKAATDMWLEALRDRYNPSKQRIEIRDASDRILLVLPLSEVIETGGGGATSSGAELS